MLFASDFGDVLFKGFLGLLLLAWVAGRTLKKFDNDGAIKGAASKGIIGMIGRWLK